MLQKRFSENSRIDCPSWRISLRVYFSVVVYSDFARLWIDAEGWGFVINSIESQLGGAPTGSVNSNRAKSMNKFMFLFGFGRTCVVASSFMLFLTGIGKVWSFGPVLFLGDVMITRFAHALLGSLEICVGVLGFVFASCLHIRVLLCLVYSVFFVVLSLKLTGGLVSCVCFSCIDAPIVLVMVAIALLLAGIGVSLFEKKSEVQVASGFVRGLYIAFGLVALALSFKFHSADQLIQVLTGRTISVDQRHKVAVAHTDKVSLVFCLFNHEGRERRIIGAKSSCGCTTLEGLPAKMLGGGKFEARMDINLGRKTGVEHSREFVSYLICDDGMHIRIRATIVF
jgi:hypothetical protein